MFDIIEPHDGPVVVGLEQFETVYAKNQPQYRPLRTLPARAGDSAIARFHLTDTQRKAVAEGADIYLELLHFRGPLAPSLLMIMSEPADTDSFRSWWKAQTRGPYPLDVPKSDGSDHNGKHTEETCLGHVASANNSKICGRCGTHIDSLRPDDDDHNI